MRCTVVGQHLRILSKSVRLMSKYSEQVTVLVKDNGIIFQAVNDSKSAFCEVILSNQFFSNYKLEENFECKVDIKSLGLVFKVINLGLLNNLTYFVYNLIFLYFQIELWKVVLFKLIHHCLELFLK